MKIDNSLYHHVSIIVERLLFWVSTVSTLFYSQARPSSPSQNPTAPAYLHSSEALYASTHLSNAPHILMNCALKEIHNLCRSCLKTSESHKVERSLIFNMHWCKETWRCTMTNRSWGTVLGSLLLFLANVLYLLDGLRCLEKTNTAKQNEFKMGYKVSKTTDFSKLSRRWFIQVLTSPEKKKTSILIGFCIVAFTSTCVASSTLMLRLATSAAASSTSFCFSSSTASKVTFQLRFSHHLQASGCVCIGKFIEIINDVVSKDL